MDIYVYSKRTKEITKLEDYTLLDTTKMADLYLVHKEDIRNNFGKIVVDETTMEPKYQPNYVSMVVDKATNDFTKVFQKGTDDDDKYYVDVLFKDYVDNTSIDLFNKVAKYYNNKFYVFEKIEEYIYNATDNTWILDVEKYKKKIINKIANSEEEIRHHGFYHSLFDDGKMYVQPFRNVNKDNDQTTLLALRYSVPQTVRKIKIFQEDEKGKRATAPGTYYWVMNGQLSNILLDSISTLIVAYSESVKQGMELLINKVKGMTDLEELKDVDQKYVQMILIGMKKAIEADPNNLALLNANKKKIKDENITLVKDVNGSVLGRGDE